MKKTIIIIAAALACSPAHANALTLNDHSSDTYTTDLRVTNAPVAYGGTGIGIGQGGSSKSNSSSKSSSTSKSASKSASKSVSSSGGNSQTVESAKNLPNLPYAADTAGPRNPELMLNNERAMIEAANAEIDSTIGKGYAMSYNFSERGVTAKVCHSDTGCTVHVFPTGSAKGITPALLESVPKASVVKINMKLHLVGRSVSIENFSNGMGASVSPAGSSSNADRELVGGVAAALTGNRGRTSERARVELVFQGQK